MTKVSLYKKTDNKLQRISKTVGAVVMIVTAAAGVCGWVSSQFQTAVANQISDFRQETEATDARHERILTRIELVMLIEHDPENIAAIEKMAVYYFQTLDGDLYMTQKYSDWAKQYGGDMSIIVRK